MCVRIFVCVETPTREHAESTTSPHHGGLKLLCGGLKHAKTKPVCGEKQRENLLFYHSHVSRFGTCRIIFSAYDFHTRK